MPAAAAVGALTACILLAPLALKWRLPARAVAVWAVTCGAACGVAVSLVLGEGPSPAWLALHLPLVIAASATAGAAAFFRDPERRPPADPSAVVSPADGEVLYVRSFAEGELPPIVKRGSRVEAFELAETAEGPRQVIGIGMHLLNVHVNRAPIAGTISGITRSPGPFLSLRRPEGVATNERVTTVIEADGASVAVIQIASRLVRRIVSYLKEGSAVAAGQRIGMIRFGSQVDLVLPGDAPVAVRPGDRVRAGETIIARLRDRTASGETDGPAARSG